MSVAQIIEELPKLTDAERTTVRRRLTELQERNEMLFLHEAADAMFQEMDQQEAKDARSKTR